MEEIRTLVEKEVLEMRQLAGLGNEGVDIKGTSVGEENGDVAELSLKLSEEMKTVLETDQLSEVRLTYSV